MINMPVEVFLIRGEQTIHLKKAIARILYSKKIEQSKISEILNLSQPMVSNYCSSNEKISDNIKKIAKEITEKIIDKQSINFQTCITFSDKNVEGNFGIGHIRYGTTGNSSIKNAQPIVYFKEGRENSIKTE